MLRTVAPGDEPDGRQPAPARQALHAALSRRSRCWLRLHRQGRTTSGDPCSSPSARLVAAAIVPILETCCWPLAKLGLKAKLSRSSLDRLTLVALPALAIVGDGRGTAASSCSRNATASASCSRTRPAAIQGGRPVIEPLAALRRALERRADPDRPAAPAWPASWRSSTSAGSSPASSSTAGCSARCCVVSFFLQLFALVSPLFFQVVMDKVLVHRGLTTLDVLVIGLVVVVVFESVLDGAAHLRLQPHHQPHRRRARRAAVPPPGAAAAGLLPGAPRRRLGRARARAGEHPQLPDRQRADAGARRRCSRSSSSR